MPQPADACVVGIGETTLDQIGVGAASFGRPAELATFTVQAKDDVEAICKATHKRFIVDVAQTEQRLAAKLAKAQAAQAA